MPPKIMDRSAENTAIPSRDLAPSPASTSAFRPAPYGRACINCVRAKCRCLIRSGENNCERCVRLRKDCRPSTPVRKKRSAPKDSSQTARLEQKLDGLVSLLKAHSRGTISAEEIDSSLSNSSSATLTSPRPDNDVTSHRNSYSNEAQSAASSFAYSLPAGVEPSPQDAQIWFRIFQDHYLRHVPFAVPYVQSANSAQLRVEKPAFWLSIMAVTCPVIKRQVSLGRALKEIISREIIMNSARTIDLLMSILIFIHWTFFFIELGPALATFPHLAAAVITDLELDSPCQSAAATQHLKHLQYKFSAFFTIPETRTQEHRRLVLAAYHTSASCAYYHQKSESVPWSMYLDETMKVLEETSDTAADMSLITQVKCMHIMSSVSKLHARLQGWENEETTQLVVPYIRALKSQVTMLKSQMPGYVAEDAFIQLTCIFMEIAIHETVFMCVSKGPLQVDHQFEIAECLVACTQAIRAWTNKILALQATDFIGMPLVIWKQFALVVHTVKRLVDLKYPLWDREFVIKTVNLPSLLDAIRSNLNHLTTLEPWKSSNIGKEDIHGRSSRFIVNSTNWANPIWGSSQQHSDVDQAYRQLRPSHASQAEAQSRSQPVVQAAASSESSVLHERQVSSSAEVLMPSMQGPMPAEMFPYFSQDPWAEDFLGLWDSYNGARMYS